MTELELENSERLGWSIHGIGETDETDSEYSMYSETENDRVEDTEEEEDGDEVEDECEVGDEEDVDSFDEENDKNLL
jgi:hypothetical protein